MHPEYNSVKTGVSYHTNSLEAGKQATKTAVEQLQGKQDIYWAMAFFGGRHDPEAVFEGIRSVLGQIPVIGGSAIGIITNDFLGYEGYECGVALFPSALSKPKILTVGNLNEDELLTGQALGVQLRNATEDDDQVLLFYDSIRSAPPPILNTASRLVEGVYQGLKERNLQIIGAGLAGNFQLTNSIIFDGEKPVKHAVVAVVLPKGLSLCTTIMHGCTPVSAFLEITKVKGPVIYEIDGRPALSVLAEMAGDLMDTDNISLSVTLGQKHGDLFAPYDESVYVNRLVMSTNPEDGSVAIFEADFKSGTKVQIMSRNHEMMVESVRKRTRSLMRSLRGKKPIFALYIDCAGRTCGFSGGEIEEANVLQNEISGAFPLFGFYSGVEIAPLLDRSRPLDWTGVLTVLTLE
jgi:hypothetical protein